MYLKVALPVPGNSIFDYLPDAVTPELQLQPGVRILVPYGHRKVTGILVSVTSVSDCPAEKLKSIIQLLDKEPLIGEAQFRLCVKTAAYYHRSLGETLALALPNYLRGANSLPEAIRVYWKLREHEYTAIVKKQAHKQLGILDQLKQSQKALPEESLLQQKGVTRDFLKTLEKKGLIEKETHTLKSQDFRTVKPLLNTQPLTLNQEQQAAVTTIKSHLNCFAPTLLHGVTGSGKTEIYLQIIEQVLRNGRQTLVLVPEIGLTPQTLSRFAKRFNIAVVTLHSGMTDKERFNSWQKAKNAEAGIVISTRSGIFTPLPYLGLIVVDEEHDASYKQQENIRYSAKDIALLLGKQENIPVILGSATPSLESMKKAWFENYHYLMLKERAGNAKPPCLTLVDIRNEALSAGLSQQVLQAVQQTIAEKKQVLIFINRRGFSPSLICSSCGAVMDCKQCDAYLTLHRHPPHLRCHHCDYQRSVPSVCSQCQGELIATGVGTERTEQALREIFSNTTILRIDRDSMSGRGKFDQALSTIQNNQPAILVGTQMLAKGHHFPAVTLVVVVNTDAGFFSTDFRGEEKTAQLLLQVAGRAGREECPGEVMIQTYNPYHEDLLTLTQEGYSAFVKKQLICRQKNNMPPYSYLAILSAESEDYSRAESLLKQAALWASEYSRQLPDKCSFNFIGPIPAPMERRQGRFRLQLLLQASARSILHTCLDRLQRQLAQLPRSKQLRWNLDVDPMDVI